LQGFVTAPQFAIGQSTVCCMFNGIHHCVRHAKLLDCQRSIGNGQREKMFADVCLK
jgi:hypothetical protein